MSSRQVISLCKDSVGFLWMFTHLGIDRYDGTEIRHYTLEDSYGSRHNLISSSSRITCDKNGAIWVSLRNGDIYSYVSQKDMFLKRLTGSQLSTEYLTLNHIYFDDKNNLWVGLSNGLHLFDNQSDSLISIKGFNEPVYKIIQTQTDTYYIGMSSGLYKFEYNSNNFSGIISKKIELPEDCRVESLFAMNGKLFVGTFSYSAFSVDLSNDGLESLSELIPSVPIRAFNTVNNKDLIVGTDGAGIFVIDPENKILLNRYISDEDNPYSLSGNTVSEILVDKQKSVWISTSTNGISCYSPQLPEINQIKHEYKNPNSLISDHVNVILEDSDGGLWFGTNNGVSFFDPKTQKWKSYLNVSDKESGFSSVVLTISEDANRRIWVGGYGIGVHIIDKQTERIRPLPDSGNKLTTEYIYSIYSDKKQVWLGGIEGRFMKYDLESQDFTYYDLDCIGDIKELNKDFLVLAVCEGIILFDKRDGKSTIINQFDSIALMNDPIRCVSITKDNHIWLATDGQGLICYHPETHETRSFSKKNGIDSNTINSLLEDDNGNIWFCTEKELYRLDPTNDLIINMNNYLGLDWGYFNPSAYLKKKNGDLAFGTANGVISFSPEFSFNSEDSVSLLFSDFKLLYKKIHPKDPNSPLKMGINETNILSLKYNQNTFSISFSALNFFHPHQYLYQYRLIGYDNEWRYAKEDRTVDFMNLAPGNYTFELRLVNKYTQQIAGERSIRFIIEKPFWNSGLAWIIYIIAISALVFFLFQYIKQRIAEHDSKEKIRFFINIAHDIQSPISLIKAPLNELENQVEFTEENRNLIQIAQQNTDKLLTMVGKILNLQKVEKETEKINIQYYNLYDYIHEKIIPFRMLASSKGIEIILNIDSDFPEVRFDKSKMETILDNLISNAIKYTEKGYITISASHSEKEWMLDIKDTGIGIPLKEQKNIFRQFYRAENAVNSNESGSGIGLVLTQKLVKLLKGKISFVSMENSGTTFKLTFPVDNETVIENNPEEAETTSFNQNEFNPIEKPVLLLAEDDNDIREYLAESLSKDYHVINVSDGEKAYEIAKEVNPDIIVSDILMPGMRGDEMCLLLKSSIETSHIPVILLSALNEKENVIMGLESGASDYIIKPFDFSILKARIKNILQGREQLRKKILSIETGLDELNYTNELDKKFLDKAIDIIQQELANPDFSINELCKNLGMSRTGVYNKIKTLTNQAPNDFIKIIRLNKAKELLKSKQYSVSEVSYMVGFSDPKYFSTSFKKQFGISPSKI